MIKILCSRIILLAGIVSLAACSSAGPSKRTTQDEGPFTARARNELAMKDPSGLLQVGEGFERSGNYQAALNIYGQAMAAAPDMVAAQVAFARASVAIGHKDRGKAMLIALLAAHPSNDMVRATLAKIHAAEGEFTAAALYITPMLNKSGISAEHLNLGGKILQVTGKASEARALFERALAISPANPEILQNLALSFAIAQDYATAVALLQKVMDKPEGLIPGKIALATVYALSGQLDAATLLARGAMPLDKANERRIFYQILPRLNGRERASAVMFDIVPKDALRRLTGHATK